MQTQAALCVLLCFVGNAAAEHYAVLVAGSSGYGNYRHQADVAHSYRVMREYGVKAENIITMMVDDVANNAENPFKAATTRPSARTVHHLPFHKVSSSLFSFVGLGQLVVPRHDPVLRVIIITSPPGQAV